MKTMHGLVMVVDDDRGGKKRRSSWKKMWSRGGLCCVDGSDSCMVAWTYVRFK